MSSITYIIEYLRRLFARVPPSVTDEHCPYCHGLGYDINDCNCTCLRGKK